MREFGSLRNQELRKFMTQPIKVLGVADVRRRRRVTRRRHAKRNPADASVTIRVLAIMLAVEH
jgi:hypothetical protein